jgi:hypothetical protein
MQPESIRLMTAYGEVYRMAPAVEMSETPGLWDDPILTVRGSSSKPNGNRSQRRRQERNRKPRGETARWQNLRSA